MYKVNALQNNGEIYFWISHETCTHLSFKCRSRIVCDSAINEGLEVLSSKNELRTAESRSKRGKAEIHNHLQFTVVRRT